MEERRRFTRIAANARVTVENLVPGLKGRVVNLSLGGIALSFQGLPSLSVGDELGLRIRMEQGSGFRAGVMVTWTRSEMVGGYWSDIDGDGLGHLRHMLAQRTGDPEAAQAELRALIRHHPELSLSGSGSGPSGPF